MDNVEDFEEIVIEDNFAENFSTLMNSSMYKEFDDKKKNSAYSKALSYYYETYIAKMKGVKVTPKIELYNVVGANDTALYLAEISGIESDKDKNGNTIQGSRKTKVYKYIQSLPLTAQQKNVLMYLAGYKPTDSGKGQINRYLQTQGYSSKEIAGLWKD
jgi:hypothetical protein